MKELRIALEAEDKATKKIDILQNKIIALNKQNAKFYEKLTGLSKKTAAYDKMRAKIQGNTVELKKKRAELARVSKGFKDMQVNQKGMVGWLRKGKEEIIGFNGAALSTLFFGMYIQQVFTGALKSIFEGYKKIIPESSEFNKQTTRLSANWEYFKFQLADAMAQSPLFNMMINGLINILKVLQSIPAPIKAAIVAFMALAAVMGGIMFITANIKLGLAGIIDGMGKLSIANSKFSLGNMALFAVVVAGIVVAMRLLKGAYDKFADSSDYARNKTEKLKESFVQTLKSGLDPLMESFDMSGLKLNNWNEMMIWLGAVIHNTINGLGVMIDTIIFLARVITNFVTATLSPFIGGLETAAETVMKLIDGDFSGAFDEATSYFTNVKDNFIEDIDDMIDSWNNLGDSLQTRMDASVSPSMAVEEYRRELAMQEYNDAKAEIDARNSPPVVNNVIVGSISDIESEIPGLREANDYLVSEGFTKNI